MSDMQYKVRLDSLAVGDLFRFDDETYEVDDAPPSVSGYIRVKASGANLNPWYEIQKNEMVTPVERERGERAMKAAHGQDAEALSRELDKVIAERESDTNSTTRQRQSKPLNLKRCMMKREILIGTACAIMAAAGLASTGDDCYYGRCTGCSDCSTKKGSIRACYQCCNDNCLGDGAVDCQDLCDGQAREQGYAVFADDPDLAYGLLRVTSARVDVGGKLTHEDLERLDWVSARSNSLAVRRMCVALIFDAWAMDQVMDPEYAASILESILVGKEAALRHTALVMISEFGDAPPMNLSVVLPSLVDDTTIDAGDFMGERDGLTVQAASRIATRHRQLAMDAIAVVTR
jgi:hypothetical protein